MIIYLTGTKPALSHTINENGIIQFRPKTGLVPVGYPYIGRNISWKI